MVQAQYNEESIRSLDWKEHIRLRPGMYIGKMGNGSSPDDGIYVLLKEVIDNSIDEFVMGNGKTIEIAIKQNKVTVRDFGRGIPLGKVIDCVSKINTGAKYDINTNTWTKLTQSPLNPSNELYYYFNGQEVVITLRYPYSYNNWGNVSSYRSEISSYNIQNNVWTNPYNLGSSLNPSNTRSFIYDDTKLIAASSGPYSVFEDGLHHNNNSINEIEIPSGWGGSYAELVKVDSNLTYLITEQGELYSLKTAYLNI